MRRSPSEAARRLLAGLVSRIRCGIRSGDEAERGSAVVEFVFLGTVLLVPVVYLIITVGQVQGASFAVIGAADQAAKVFAAADSPAAGQARAEQAVAIAVADHGFGSTDASVSISCSSSPCLEPGSTATVSVSLRVPLPFVPAIAGVPASAATVGSESTQIVERFG